MSANALPTKDQFSEDRLYLQPIRDNSLPDWMLSPPRKFPAAPILDRTLGFLGVFVLYSATWPCILPQFRLTPRLTDHQFCITLSESAPIHKIIAKSNYVLAVAHRTDDGAVCETGWSDPCCTSGLQLNQDLEIEAELRPSEEFATRCLSESDKRGDENFLTVGTAAILVTFDYERRGAQTATSSVPPIHTARSLEWQTWPARISDLTSNGGSSREANQKEFPSSLHDQDRRLRNGESAQRPESL